jgi:dTDP-4-dehydrorhamnose 3,5-epimerase
MGRDPITRRWALKLSATSLSGAYLLETDRQEDERGQFERVFAPEALQNLGPLGPMELIAVSSNHRRGTLRGMHYQAAPHEQSKLVRCTRGSISDVIVDVRRESLTYLRWEAFSLSAGDPRLLFIPAGFAHGFQTLEDSSDVTYVIWGRHEPAAERGLRYDDPRLGIDWPLPATVMSTRDRTFPLLGETR